MQSSDEIENAIRNNITWSKLPTELRVVLGSSQREYEKRILDYSIRNQLRYKENIVRYVKKSEEEYYEAMLNYSQSHMMVYPYHLSDIVVRGLRVTPFNYYRSMIDELMQSEKSYDSLPNFTAADVLQILGIGRNQYIELMNQNRATRRLFRRSKSVKDILPQKPSTSFNIEPWYLLCYGCVLENDVKLLTSLEKEIIDKLMDRGPTECGLFDKEVVMRLISRGLVYLDVPVQSEDVAYVPTLDGFVMNRVQGDYFETLLYKIFIAIDGQATVKELAEIIDMSEVLVKNAVSVFCRLGFVRKRITGLENAQLHKSWVLEADNSAYLGNDSPLSPTSDEPSATITITPTLDLGSATDDDDVLFTDLENALSPEQTLQAALSPTALPTPTPGGEAGAKRVAFIFDSTLTAILMMGNLSASLKNHAVTLFEVGKLADETIDNFIEELLNVNSFAEGEAQRYSEQARTLLHTIQTLRANNEVDLIRGESLVNLEEGARLRMVQRGYKTLVSMAPLGAEACSLPPSTVPHLGTPSVEMATPWFKLFLYELAGSGPASIFLPAGTIIRRLPSMFWKCRRLLVTQGTHEPVIMPTGSSLFAIQELVAAAPVLIQAYSELIDDSEIVTVPFSFKVGQDAKDTERVQEEKDGRSDVRENSFQEHPAVQTLREKLSLDHLCGYIALLKLHNCTNGTGSGASRTIDELTLGAPDTDYADDSDRRSSPAPPQTGHQFPASNLCYGPPLAKDPRRVGSMRALLRDGEQPEDYALLDCLFGIPLFDEQLNRVVCHNIIQNGLLCTDSQDAKFAVHNTISQLKQFIGRYQNPNYEYLFIDLNFKRPFFTTFVKSIMFSLFLLRYALRSPSQSGSGTKKRRDPTGTGDEYARLETHDGEDYEHAAESSAGNVSTEEEEEETVSCDDADETDGSDYVLESLTTAEFEPLFFATGSSCSEMDETEKHTAETTQTGSATEEVVPADPSPPNERLDGGTNDEENERGKRRVRFHLLREVRSFPQRIAKDAKVARLPYRASLFDCSSICNPSSSPLFTYSVYFAPLWFTGSVTYALPVYRRPRRAVSLLQLIGSRYQVALVFTTVSSVNLISASTSLFILILEAMCGHKPSDRFTLTKLVLVLMNIGGVAVVSQFSSSLYGAAFSMLSALTWAFYLFAFSVVSSRCGRIDMNLMFGIIGVLSCIFCTPAIWALHLTGLEPQLPLPTQLQMLLVLLNGLVGSILADYLWIYATLLTNSLVSSLSTTLSIPLAMVADSVFRNQPPNLAQILSSIPIMISFVGATYLASRAHTRKKLKRAGVTKEMRHAMKGRPTSWPKRVLKGANRESESQNLIDTPEPDGDGL